MYLYMKDSGEGVPGDMLVLPVEVSPSQVTSENKGAILYSIVVDSGCLLL